MDLTPAAPADVAPVAALIRTSKAVAMPWLAVVHTPEEDLGWVRSVLLAQHAVTVAREDDDVVGVLATSPGWVDQLYVLPERQGRGVGRALLDHAKAGSTGDLQLWTFTRNVRARAFYERAGFTAEEQTDGSGNEEREPDVRYRWRGWTAAVRVRALGGPGRVLPVAVDERDALVGWGGLSAVGLVDHLFRAGELARRLLAARGCSRGPRQEVERHPVALHQHGKDEEPPPAACG